MNPFKNEPLRNRIALYAIFILGFVLFLFLAFDAGMGHQKEIGPPGHECKTGTYRQPGDPEGAAVCENGFWFSLAPETFPRDKLEEKKP